jgi:hypothetical protein
VDHLAVARRRDRADVSFGFKDDDLASLTGQAPGDGKADHAGSDNHALNIIH